MSRTIRMTMSDDASDELARIAHDRALSTGEALRRALDLLRNENEAAVQMDLLRAERDRLQAIVDRLLKTADGVPILEGDYVWINAPTPYRVRVDVVELAHKRVYLMLEGRPVGLKVVSACYSTREAAEAARGRPCE